MFRVFSPKSKKKKKAKDEKESSKSSSMSTLSLRVEVLEARDLRAADRNKSSDPFVLVSVGKEKFKTSVVKKNLNPKWTSKNTFVFGK